MSRNLQHGIAIRIIKSIFLRGQQARSDEGVVRVFSASALSIEMGCQASQLSRSTGCSFVRQGDRANKCVSETGERQRQRDRCD